MSGEEEDSGKGMAQSGAAETKDPKTRVEELKEETKGDRKKMALTMKAEGYNRVEISHAFKEVTGTGLGPAQWKEWEDADKLKQQVTEAAVPILTKQEAEFMVVVAAKYKKLNEILQAQVIEFGMYILESVTPQVPADRPEDKVKNTLEWLKKAVIAFDPEEMMEIEKFGAAAFLAAQELKTQITVLMAWADPSSRLQEMAEKALYSLNAINEKAFNVLMLELVKSIHGVPRFGRGEQVSELPGIVKSYAEARGVTQQEAEKIMIEVVQEVAGSV